MTQRVPLICFTITFVAAGQSYTPPRTPDGQPDLQGIWTNGTVTPFERPAALAGKAFFTEQEAGAYEKQMASARNSDQRGATAEQDLASAYNNRWYDWGSKVVKTRRTSMILDPPDGRVPALTAKGKEMQREWAERQRGLPAGPEDIGLAERCIVFPTAGPPMLPYAYNNNYRILQARDFVAITIEMVHDVRIIPTDGSPHLAPAVRQWLGDSRGHWEGSTLVVDTTNFNGKNRFGPFFAYVADEHYHVTERFTRTDPDTILYQFTIDDPTIYVRPFSGELTMSRTPGPTYEYACHEGNYAMADMLRGARAEEKKSAGR
ncbi:MAG TPA: hypothetical protein VMH80_20355 [Bryobacteraceae bacterium]|nr:hypothetical protein [Bryobacteraceae bacterium]